jgi:hypothetical protein
MRTVSPASAAWRTAAATSSADRGVPARTGLTRWFPAQLRHVGLVLGDIRRLYWRLFPLDCADSY